VSRLGVLFQLEAKGHMAIPSPMNNLDQARSYFWRLLVVALNLPRQLICTISLREISVGGLNEYHGAVEEGATMVRVGTAILGVRSV
jgi:uncharacterized pyridoxal phosphate-containing UPF0001 family protein